MSLNCTTNPTTATNVLHSTFPGSSTVPTTNSVTTMGLQPKTVSPTMSAHLGSARILPADKPSIHDSEFDLTDVALPSFQRKRRSLSMCSDYSSPSNMEIKDSFSSSVCTSPPSVKKRTNSECVGEKRKHFMIDEMLEQYKTYPQDLDTALNLSNQTTPGMFYTNAPKKVAIHENISEETDVNSLRRVPCLSSQNVDSNPIQDTRTSQNVQPRTVCASLSPIHNFNATVQSTSPADLRSNSFGHVSISNEKFLPHKLRFKATSRNVSPSFSDYGGKASNILERGPGESGFPDVLSRANDVELPPIKKTKFDIKDNFSVRSSPRSSTEQESGYSSSEAQDVQVWNKSRNVRNIAAVTDMEKSAEHFLISSSNVYKEDNNSTTNFKEASSAFKRVCDGSLDLRVETNTNTLLLNKVK